jgi:hypothetical protein
LSHKQWNERCDEQEEKRAGAILAAFMVNELEKNLLTPSRSIHLNQNGNKIQTNFTKGALNPDNPESKS